MTSDRSLLIVAMGMFSTVWSVMSQFTKAMKYEPAYRKFKIRRSLLLKEKEELFETYTPGLSEDLATLHDRHGNGDISDAEFATHRTAMINKGAMAVGIPVDSPILLDYLKQIRVQSEVAHLDRSWEIERKRWMVRWRRRYQFPSWQMSLFGVALLCGLGILLLEDFSKGGLPVAGRFIGIGFILYGVFAGIYGYLKLWKYKRAYEDYRSRRSHLFVETKL